MTVQITLLYAALSGLWLLVLSARVIIYRRTKLIEIGDGKDRAFAFRVRAQANFCEYAPLALLLLALIELQGAPALLLHLLGLTFLAGRLMHGWSFSFASGAMRWRVLGMVLTTMIAAACVTGLFHAFS